MSLRDGLTAAIVERIPWVGFADVSGDGKTELVIGPQPSGATGTVLRHADDLTLEFGRVVIVFGVR